MRDAKVSVWRQTTSAFDIAEKEWYFLTLIIFLLKSTTNKVLIAFF